jgi:hypothetical protein
MKIIAIILDPDETRKIKAILINQVEIRLFLGQADVLIFLTVPYRGEVYSLYPVNGVKMPVLGFSNDFQR